MPNQEHNVSRFSSLTKSLALERLTASLDTDATLLELSRLVRVETNSDLACVGVAENSEWLRLSYVSGNLGDQLVDLRVRLGSGLGGQAFGQDRPFSVLNYVQDRSITHHYDGPVSSEAIQSAHAVPLTLGHTNGVIYVARRSATAYGDRTTDKIEQAALQAELALSIAEHSKAKAAVALHEDRQRIALELHDTVGAMLFAIGAGAQNLAAAEGDVSSRAEKIAEQASAAAHALRMSIATLDEPPSELELPVAIKKDCRSLERRSGITTSVILMTELPELDPERRAICRDVVRETLLNAEKHSGASVVIVSLCVENGDLQIAVADDGLPLDIDELQSGFGLTSSRDRLAAVGGSLQLNTDDDGGLTVRVRLPL